MHSSPVAHKYKFRTVSEVILISNFLRVLNVVFFLLGYSLASDFLDFSDAGESTKRKDTTVIHICCESKL
jgi:hypothetical protein